jgi:oligopeptide transport system permease protein
VNRKHKMEINLKKEQLETGLTLEIPAENSLTKPLPRALRGDKPRTLWGDALRRLRRNKLALVGFGIICLLIFCALFAPFITSYNYATQNYDHIAETPNEQFWFGTDQLGRDMFSRVIYGAQVSLIVGLMSQLIALVIGVPIGMLAGYFGGKVDMVLMRVVDVTYAFPQLLFVILLMSMLGPGLMNILIALGLTTWVTLSRLVRSEFLKLKTSDFVLAAQAIGVSPLRLMLRHMLPNAFSPIIVAFTFGIPSAIFTEATLSFIGVGISPPTPSWGQMVGENYQYIRSLWHLATFPVLAIALTMFGFSFFGDGLRDALDPRSSGNSSKLG